MKANPFLLLLFTLIVASAFPGCDESARMREELDRLAKRVDEVEKRQVDSVSKMVTEPTNLQQRRAASKSIADILAFVQLQINTRNGWLNSDTTAKVVSEFATNPELPLYFSESHIHLTPEGELVYQRFYGDAVHELLDHYSSKTRNYNIVSVDISLLNPDSVKYVTSNNSSFILIRTTNNAPVVTGKRIDVDVLKKSHSPVQTFTQNDITIACGRGVGRQLERALRDLILQSDGKPDLYSADELPSESK